VTTGDAKAFAADLVEKADTALALYGPISRAPEREALAGRLVA
jgi:hypothetical protein